MNGKKKIVKIGHSTDSETKTVTVQICNNYRKLYSLNGGTIKFY